MRGDLKIMDNKELKERFIDEKTGIEYVRQGDYYFPNLVLAKQKKIHLKNMENEFPYFLCREI